MKRIGIAMGITLVAMAGEARADDAQEQGAIAPAQVDLDKDVKPSTEEASEPPPEAPPPVPYKKTFVIDSSIGAMAFLGQFGKAAPAGPWMHTQLGYELAKWLMVFGEGDLAFTNNSGRVDPPGTRVFPIFGFGAGGRLTVRFTDRLGVYAQASFGAMKADTAHNALGLIGFKDAESLGIYAAGRLGVEWYQLDRHFGLGLTIGLRDAQGFAALAAGSDTPLALDGGVSLRYAF